MVYEFLLHFNMKYVHVCAIAVWECIINYLLVYLLNIQYVEQFNRSLQSS